MVAGRRGFLIGILQFKNWINSVADIFKYYPVFVVGISMISKQLARKQHRFDSRIFRENGD